MAAPIGAYRNRSLFARKGTADIEHLIAILQVSENVMKARFYLDDLVAAKLPDGTEGVAGAVIIGGANEAMHNLTTRGGSYYGDDEDDNKIRLLNDAGLNTKGLVTDIHPELEGEAAIVKNIPAFYGTTTIELYARHVDSGGSGVGNFDYYGEITLTGDGTIKDARFDKAYFSLPTGERQWMAKAINTEGTTESGYYNFEVAPDAQQEDVYVSISSVTGLGTKLEIVFLSDVNVDADLTANFSLNDSTAFSGIIYAGTNFGVTYVDTSMPSGMVYLNSLSDGNPITQIYHVGNPNVLPFTNGGAGGSDIVVNSTGLTCAFYDPTGEFTLYFNVSDGRYYFNAGFTNPVGNFEASYWNGSVCKWYKFSGSYLIQEG